MSSYIVFISYAHADHDSYLTTFVKNLVDELRRNQPFPVHQAIEFLDQPEIERGSDWEQKLVAGLQGARVFIPLYSPNYFESEYSGKEWAFFHERCERQATSNGQDVIPALIKPVIWIPPASNGRPENRTTVLPEAVNPKVKKLQYTRGEQRANANVNGVRAMLKRLNDISKSEYFDYLDELVREILTAITTFAPFQLNPAPALDAVKAAFPIKPSLPAPAANAVRAATPRLVQPNKRVGFVVIAASAPEVPPTRVNNPYGQSEREEWQPFLPGDTEQIGLVVQQTAGRLKVLSDFIPFERASFRQRLDEARGRGQVVILLVDGWTLTLADEYVVALCEFDAGSYDNCGVIIPHNPNDSDLVGHEAAVADALNRALYRRMTIWNPLFLRKGATSREIFEAELEDLITRLRATVVNSRPPEREVPRSDILKAVVRSQ